MALFWPGSAMIRAFLLTFHLEKLILLLKYFKMARSKKENISSKEQQPNMVVIEQDNIFDRLENKYSLRELLDIETALKIVLEEDRKKMFLGELPEAKKMFLGELPEATEFNQLSKNYYRILGTIKNKLITMLK